jgi:hypothetical protein
MLRDNLASSRNSMAKNSQCEKSGSQDPRPAVETEKLSYFFSFDRYTVVVKQQLLSIKVEVISRQSSIFILSSAGIGRSACGVIRAPWRRAFSCE